MQKLIVFTITALLTGMASAADIYHEGWVDRNKNGEMDPYENPALPVEERVADLLARMTMDEKTCQMGTIYGYKRVLKSPTPEESWKDRVWKDGVANIDEHGNGAHVKGMEYIEFDKHAELINIVQKWFTEETRLGIPVDFTNEGIRGVCHSRASNFPSQLGLGASFDKDLIRRIGEITGREAKALGYSNIYSPILDTVRDPRWGRTIECYGESPYLVGELGKQQVLGLQSEGVASTPKHFAAYSNPNGGRDGSGRTDPQVPYRDMHEILMHPFRKAFIEAHAKGTMSSYNTYDGVPVTGSPYFLTELLRGEYGFRGYVVSDSGAVERLYRQHDVAEDFEDAIVQAVNAGLNVRTNFREMEHYVEPLRKVISEGRISEETVNARVADVLRVKFELGLFDHPVVDPERALEVVHCPEHEAVTLEAARKSMVLIKNDGVLPLSTTLTKTVLVTGPGADDPGALTSRYGPALSDSITPYAGIKEFLSGRAKVLYTKGIDYKDEKFPLSDLLDIPLTDDEQDELDKAADMAQKADAIVVVVGDNDDDTVSESHSRTSLDLPGHQLKLVQAMVKTGKPVVVVLMVGRAASINWTDRNAPAILACWHGGEKAGQALAETIFGEYNPGGKLPITFPRTAGQVPLCIPHRKGAWGGQKEKPDENGWGRTRALDPLYYFGHGLSYTTFEYSNLKVAPQNPTADTPITISCDVTNTGGRAGDEVAQLYITDAVASVAPYDQILRGFERISLKPGQTEKVTFTLSPRRDLKMLNRDNEWVVEPGKFEVKAGTSSAPDGIRLRSEFVIQ